MTANWGMLFLIGFGGLFGLYFIFGMYANVQAGKSNPVCDRPLLRARSIPATRRLD